MRGNTIWTVDDAGWLVAPLDRLTRAPSPHCDERPADTLIDLLVVHNISLPPGEFGGDAILQFFAGTLDCSAHPYYAQQLVGLRVSAHFLIRRSGHLVQFVSCKARAWHAGASSFEGRARCNDFSIGVELEGTDDTPYEDAQYESLSDLTRALATAYPLRAVQGHSHIAPERKTDPGQSFDWPRFARMAASPRLAFPKA